MRSAALQAEIERLQAKIPTPPTTSASVPTPPPEAVPPEAGRLATARLRPGLERARAAAARLMLRPDTSAVVLHLVVEDDPPAALWATVQTPEGRPVFTQGPLAITVRDEERAVTAWIPRAALAPGDYVVVLHAGSRPGVSDVAEYVLRIAAAQ